MLFKIQPLIDLLLQMVSTRLIATLFRQKKTDILHLLLEPSDGEHPDLGGVQHSHMGFHELLFKLHKGSVS